MTIHIVGKRELFSWEPYAFRKSYVNGYAHLEKDEIWLLGVRTNEGIVVNQNTLGHEFLHFIHYYDNEVTDPHNYDNIEK